MHYVNSKTILSKNNGMNLYRGCSHGCRYCHSRSNIYGMDHEFEDIEVKQNAPALLEAALRSKRKKCMIGTGAMSDPYMHCEEKLRLTRKCLEIILKYGFGAAIQTKSDRILQDIDLLDEINYKLQNHPDLILVKQKISSAEELRNTKIDVENKHYEELEKCNG